MPTAFFDSQNATDLAYLRVYIEKGFNLSELKNVCYDLDISFENLSGDTLSDKARELIQYSSRSGMLANLLARLSEERPNINWYKLKTTEIVGDRTSGELSDPTLEMYELAKEFNRSRRIPLRNDRLKIAGDIVLDMRILSPRIGTHLDLYKWLRSVNQGKRLAAIVYLSWLQDIEYIDTLLAILLKEKSAFLQFNILSTIYSMADQINPFDQDKIASRLQLYNPENARDRTFWKNKILEKLSVNPRASDKY